MDSPKDGKRRKDKYDEDDERRRQKRSRRDRSRSTSYDDRRERDSRRKRRHSRSRSTDTRVKNEKFKEGDQKETERKDISDRPERKAKETDMLNTRTGGAYIPPARLRMMQAQITDKSSVAYQRLAWEALKKSIHGHINKINVGNIGIIIKELLKENIVRGRGLLCRSVIQAQAASPTFTNVYAALVAAVNSRFPNIGELLLKRLVIQFKRGFKRNDKSICISSASFIAHLVNQRVAHEILALELLTLLVETPTDDSVEVAIAFLKECGQKLTEVSSKGVNAIFEMLRNILHEGQLDKRVQYMIEVMFQVWKDGFKDHPALIEELELVPEEEQFTHLLMLDDATDPQDILNVFKFDDKYEENEQKYKTLSKEILGSDAESGEDDGSGESGSEESEEEEEVEEKKEMTIIDNTETNLVALRRTIYLTINSSLDFEECAHKLMKMQLKPGQEVELCHMFLDCCAEQRTYEKFYGLLAQRFCNINRIYIGPFEEIFKDSYATAHRLDTNRLRNVSKFFAHLLFTDSISWEVLECVKLNEEDTTSSSRIYIKILFQELAEYMGLKKLNDRLQDPTLQEAFLGIFPRDNPRNTRFSINFFTSIGLGGLTDELREHLKQMPKNVPAPVTDINIESESSSESSSTSSSSSSSSSDDSSSSSDSSSSDSEGETKKKKKKKEKSKSKNKNKDKSPKAPEVNNDAEKNTNNDRWGHDGFFDTYGKDARRMESRPERERERSDRDHFARPHDFKQGNRNWNKDQKNGDDRRRFDRDREDDLRRRNEEKRRERSPEQPNRNRDSNRESDDARKYEESRNRRRDRNDDNRESDDNRKHEESRNRRRDRSDDNREFDDARKYEESRNRRRNRNDDNRESDDIRKLEESRNRRRDRSDDNRESDENRKNEESRNRRRDRSDDNREFDDKRKNEEPRNRRRDRSDDNREFDDRKNEESQNRRRDRRDDNRESSRQVREDDRQKDTSRYRKEHSYRGRDRENRHDENTEPEKEKHNDDDKSRRQKDSRQEDLGRDKKQKEDRNKNRDDEDSDYDKGKVSGRYWDNYSRDRNRDQTPEIIEKRREKTKQSS